MCQHLLNFIVLCIYVLFLGLICSMVLFASHWKENRAQRSIRGNCTNGNCDKIHL